MNSFRGSVFEGANKCGNQIFFLNDHFRKSIVCEFYVSFVGDEDIFWFKLTVDNSFAVEKLNSHNYLGNQHLDYFFLELYVLLSEIEIDISPRQILHHNVYFVLVLKGLPYGHK